MTFSLLSNIAADGDKAITLEILLRQFRNLTLFAKFSLILDIKTQNLLSH